MSQANELLDSLSEEDIVAYTGTPETEEHIVVDINRRITVPESLKRIGVQFDHNIETVTFDCPRYWDGIDLSTMKLYVNYMRSDGKRGSYHSDTVTIDESDDTTMHFDWTIDSFATEVKGNLSFLVCAKNVNSQGVEENHWNSELNRDLTISEGLECEESIVNSYPAIITQLLVRMDRVDTIATEEAMRRYVAEYFADVDSVIFLGGDSENSTDIVAEFDIDNAMSANSDNPVQNKVVKAYVDNAVSDKATYEYVNNAVDIAKDAAIDTANSDTDAKLEKYTTTEEADIKYVNAEVYTEDKNEAGTERSEMKKKLDSVGDYIVERGSSKDCYWAYEKWNSGRAICYGRVPYNFKGTGPTGALFAENPVISLPSGVFNGTPTWVFCGVDLPGSASAKLWTPNNSKDTIEVIVTTTEQYGSGNQCTLMIEAVGTWK